MDETFAFREDLDKRSKALHGFHQAVIGFADFRFLGHEPDGFGRGLAAFRFPRDDMHGAIVGHVDLCSRAVDEPSDRRAPGADNLADEFRVDLHVEDPRRLHRQRSGLRERRGHDRQDMGLGCLRAFEGLGQHRESQPRVLHVHLDRGDARGGASHLEVHVSVEVFLVHDVGEESVVAVLLDQTDGHAGYGRGDRDPCVHQREAVAADRGHGAGRTGLQHVRHDSDRVGEVLRRRHHRHECLAGQVSVADVAAAGTPNPAHLADAEGREVVVDQEPLEALASELLHTLFVVASADGRRHQSLCLSSGEEGRPMCLGQPADLARDRPDFIEPAAVAALALHGHVAQDPFGRVLERRGHCFGFRIGEGFGHVLLDLVSKLSHAGGSGLLAVRAESRADIVAVAGEDIIVPLGPAGAGRRGVRRAKLGGEFLDEVDGLLGRLKAEGHGFHDVGVPDLLAHELDHQDAFARRGQHEMEVTVLELRMGGVEHKLPLDAAHRDRADGRHGHVGAEPKRGSRAEHRDVCRIVLLVGREHQDLYARVPAVVVGEEWPEGPVDHATVEGLLVRGPAFALVVAGAADDARRVAPLHVVDGKGHEGEVRILWLHDGRGEDHRAPVLRDHRLGRLSSHLACLEAENASAEFSFTLGMQFHSPAA